MPIESISRVASLKDGKSNEPAADEFGFDADGISVSTNDDIAPDLLYMLGQAEAGGEPGGDIDPGLHGTAAGATAARKNENDQTGYFDTSNGMPVGSFKHDPVRDFEMGGMMDGNGSVTSDSTTPSLRSRLFRSGGAIARNKRRRGDSASETSFTSSKSDPALRDVAKSKNFARYLQHHAVRRYHMTRLLEGTQTLYFVGLMVILDGLGRLIRIAAQAESVAGISSHLAVQRVLSHTTGYLFAGGVCLALYAAFSIRRTVIGRNHYMIVSDDEPSVLQPIVNIAVVIGMGILCMVTAKNLYSDPDIGCMCHQSSELMSTATMCTLLLAMQVIYCADLHGMYRPRLWFRLSVITIMAAISLIQVWVLTTISGYLFLVGDSADQVKECRHRLYHGGDITDGERLFVGLQFIVAIFVTIVAQDERNVVLLSIGDRIMEQLADLQHKMVKRTYAIAKVVQKVVPRPILTQIRVLDQKISVRDQFLEE